MLKRIKTGIPGLDKLIEGGLIEGSVTMVTGSTGTGKTIFASQFIYEGLKKGEPCVFITLEEKAEDIIEDVKVFGWDFEEYKKKGLLEIIYQDPSQMNNLSSNIIGYVSNINAKRLVIDSTSVMSLAIGDSANVRRKLLGLINSIKRNKGLTTIITSEIPEESKNLSRFGVEEFVVDGVIVLSYLGIGGTESRSLMIRKMRRTNHGKEIYPFNIKAQGIEINAKDSMTTLMR